MRENPLRDLEAEGIALIYLTPEEYLSPRMLKAVRKKKGSSQMKSFYVIAVNVLETSPEAALQGSVLVQYEEGRYLVAGASAERGIGPWLYWGAFFALYIDESTEDDWLYSDDELTRFSTRVWERLVSDGWAVKMPDRYRGVWRGDRDMYDAISDLFTQGTFWLEDMREEDPLYAVKLSNVADDFFMQKFRDAQRLVANKSKTNDEVYEEWKKLVNMTAKELKDFMDEYGDEAGLSRAEASAQGIKSGRDSARAILRMKRKKKSEWNDNDWNWARRQVNFIKRMSGMRGSLKDSKGEPTRKYLALLVWGHDPLKK
jgi:hypothetical protein